MANKVEGIIKWNKIQCLNCKDIIESKNKHDDVMPYISMTRRIVRALVRE